MISGKTGYISAIAAALFLSAMDEEEMLDPDAREPGSVTPAVTAEEQMAICRDDPDNGQARALISVEGFKEMTGNVRVQAYGDNPEEFLESGAWIVRLDLPVEEDIRVCLPLPDEGRYALVIMHDIDADGRADVFSEGFGFSRNPSLGMTPPDHDEVVTRFGPGVTELAVELQYMFGGNDDRRRRRRR